MNEITLAVTDGRITTTSRQIAEHFGKRHTNVLRSIANLDCSEEFARLNFEPAHYNDENGQPRQEYTLTRDGFVFLCMGFTGKEAAAWKEKYIAAFNAMEAQLRLPFAKTINLREVMLCGGSNPSVPVPRDIQAALNRKAWTMAHSAYELCREYLARRVADTSEMGYPRFLHEENALKAIEGATLDAALIGRHYDMLRNAVVIADSLALVAQKNRDELAAVLHSECAEPA